MPDELPLPPRIVPPDAGTVIRAFGDEARFHLTGEDTGGRLTVFTLVTPPGGGPPPHRHFTEDEWFLPMEGRVEFLANDEWREVPCGTLVYMPRGAVHTFRNPGSTPLVMRIHTAPSGFETFFNRCATEFAREGGPDMQRLVAIAGEHGIEFV